MNWAHLYEWTVTHNGTAGGRTVKHLRIQRRDRKPIRVGWDTLQRMKNEIMENGPELCMVEIFPPASRVVDEINARHLWEILPEAAPFLGRLDRA